MIVCPQSFALTVNAQSCAADVGPAVPVQWNGAVQPTRVRIQNYSTFLNALGACPTCVYQGIAPPVWDGTLPQQYAPDNFTLKWFTAGGAPPGIIAAYYLSSPNTNYLIGVELDFISGAYWKIIINCYDAGGSQLPNPVWEGHKVAGLTPVDQAGTFVLVPGTLAGAPACLHMESY